MQADYEQELAVQRAAHKRELVRSKDDLLNLLAVAEAKTIHIDEDSIRKKYTKEIERISVSHVLHIFNQVYLPQMGSIGFLCLTANQKEYWKENSCPSLEVIFVCKKLLMLTLVNMRQPV